MARLTNSCCGRRSPFGGGELLGWEKIECLSLNCDERDAQLWEIAENLHRADLTALQRSKQVALWIKLTEEKQAEAAFRGNLPRNSGAGRPAGGRKAASRELGVDERAARRAEKIADLSEEAQEAAKEVGLDDNQTALLAAAKLPALRRKSPISIRKRSAAKPRRPARKRSGTTKTRIASSRSPRRSNSPNGCFGVPGRGRTKSTRSSLGSKADPKDVIAARSAAP